MQPAHSGIGRGSPSEYGISASTGRSALATNHQRAAVARLPDRALRVSREDSGQQGCSREA